MQNVSRLPISKTKTPARKSDRRAAVTQKEQEWNNYSKGDFKFEPFRPLSKNQHLAYASGIENDITIAIGPAGTGKSFAGAHAAAKLLAQGAVKQIILTRSPLPTGQTAGFRPGDTYEKLIPYLTPLIETLKKVMRTPSGSDGFFNYLWEKKIINIRDLETIKGSSLDDAFIIVEEAQECDTEQLRNLLTRSSDSSYIFLNGDLKQSNARLRNSALGKYVESFRDYNDRLARGTLSHLYDENGDKPDWMKYIDIIEFNKNDRNGRGGLCRLMLEINDMYDI